MIEGQLTLPVLPGPALVAGPVFISFEVRGSPGHKARHRSRLMIPREAWSIVAGQRVITGAGVKRIFISNYPDPATEAYEKILALAARSIMRSRPPTVKPCALLVHSLRPIPQSWSQRNKDLALAHAILPTSRPDWDNYGKITDALKGIVWMDDAQVVDGRVIKRYSAQPALRIEVREMIDP